jgi:hypothetical protein
MTWGGLSIMFYPGSLVTKFYDQQLMLCFAEDANENNARKINPGILGFYYPYNHPVLPTTIPLRI